MRSLKMRLNNILIFKVIVLITSQEKHQTNLIRCQELVSSWSYYLSVHLPCCNVRRPCVLQQRPIAYNIMRGNSPLEVQRCGNVQHSETSSIKRYRPMCSIEKKPVEDEAYMTTNYDRLHVCRRGRKAGIITKQSIP